MFLNKTQCHDRVPKYTKPDSKITPLAFLGLGLATSLSMNGCLAAAAAAGAGAGYAVGHEQGEDHVNEGVHEDDD